jgi:[acyl-carrier-protein] S-malonyltransferase
VTPRTALVFPGQGSQRHGMLDALPQPDSVARLLDAAEALSDLDVRAVAAMGTPQQLADTRAAQPLLYLADWAWGTEATMAGVAPAAVAGHSLGELAALAVAGVFSVEAGLELVVERSRLMAACAASVPGGMAAVLGLESGVIAATITGIPGVWVANDNAPGQTVISGTHEGIAAASEALSGAGARRIVQLQVAGPFHSPIMAPAADAFAAILRETAFADATLPVFQNADPTPETRAGALRDRLVAQIVSPVRWTETMANMRKAGIGMLLECGPGTILAGLARRVDGLTAQSVEQCGIDCLLDKENDFDGLLEEEGGS